MFFFVWSLIRGRWLLVAWWIGCLGRGCCVWQSILELWWSFVCGGLRAGPGLLQQVWTLWSFWCLFCVCVRSWWWRLCQVTVTALLRCGMCSRCEWPVRHLPTSETCYVVGWEVEFYVSGSLEVLEDLFEFTPIVFVWTFDTCGEEGDSRLDISSSYFAEE